MTAARAPATPLHLSPEVERALKRGQAVVALESTIISHGMPYPQNVATAREVESIVRHGGAVPATVAVLDGRLCVGLTPAQLEQLGKLGSQALKCSRRDIAYALATGQAGATTVSGTMLAAALAGIRVFVTGGLGGVHRDGHITLDISADLTELGRTPVAVVCAGAKSLLDIPRTLEYLETQGVPVVGYRTDDFPAFFSPTSGCPVSCRLDSPEACARMLHAQLLTGIRTGMVVACPIPSAAALDAADAEKAVQDALREAKAQNVSGRALTPFLLRRINELSKGDSLKSNIALVKNNAALGTAIAVALSRLERPKARL